MKKAKNNQTVFYRSTNLCADIISRCLLRISRINPTPPCLRAIDSLSRCLLHASRIVCIKDQPNTPCVRAIDSPSRCLLHASRIVCIKDQPNTPCVRDMDPPSRCLLHASRIVCIKNQPNTPLCKRYGLTLKVLAACIKDCVHQGSTEHPLPCLRAMDSPSRCLLHASRIVCINDQPNAPCLRAMDSPSRCLLYGESISHVCQNAKIALKVKCQTSPKLTYFHSELRYSESSYINFSSVVFHFLCGRTDGRTDGQIY